MKRHELTRHLNKHGCVLYREGSGHSIFVNIATMAVSTIPRHKEVRNIIAQKICKELGIPPMG